MENEAIELLSWLKERAEFHEAHLTRNYDSSVYTLALVYAHVYRTVMVKAQSLFGLVLVDEQQD